MISERKSPTLLTSSRSVAGCSSSRKNEIALKKNRDKITTGSRNQSFPSTSGSRAKAKITVVVRKRPLCDDEILKNEADVISATNDYRTIIVNEPRKNVCGTPYTEPHEFVFDRAYTEKHKNKDVYGSCVKQLVDSIFTQNSRCACFAFGQTGSGKTYTMIGPGKSMNCSTDDPGILELSAIDCFEWLKQPEFVENLGLHVSFFEIYCNKVYDLLNERYLVRALETKSSNGVVVKDLKVVKVSSTDILISLLDVGLNQRIIGTNSKNSDSSRGHAVLTFDIRNIHTDKTFGKLVFVDLAGSERGIDAMGCGKQTQTDGAGINRSLLALKECIRALDQQSVHVPFRDSELTKVLRDMFIGDKNRTLMISCVSPASSCCEQSLNTLRYAYRVKMIRRNCESNIDNNNDISLLDQSKYYSFNSNSSLHESASIETWRYRDKPLEDKMISESCSTESRVIFYSDDPLDSSDSPVNDILEFSKFKSAHDKPYNHMNTNGLNKLKLDDNQLALKSARDKKMMVKVMVPHGAPKSPMTENPSYKHSESSTSLKITKPKLKRNTQFINSRMSVNPAQYLTKEKTSSYAAKNRLQPKSKFTRPSGFEDNSLDRKSNTKLQSNQNCNTAVRNNALALSQSYIEKKKSDFALKPLTYRAFKPKTKKQPLNQRFDSNYEPFKSFESYSRTSPDNAKLSQLCSEGFEKLSLKSSHLMENKMFTLPSQKCSNSNTHLNESIMNNSSLGIANKSSIVNSVFSSKNENKIMAAALLIAKSYDELNLPIRLPESTKFDQNHHLEISTALELLNELLNLPTQDILDFHTSYQNYLKRKYSQLIDSHYMCITKEQQLRSIEDLAREYINNTSHQDSREINVYYIDQMKKTSEIKLDLYGALSEQLVDMEKMLILQQLILEAYQTASSSEVEVYPNIFAYPRNHSINTNVAIDINTYHPNDDTYVVNPTLNLDTSHQFDHVFPTNLYSWTKNSGSTTSSSNGDILNTNFNRNDSPLSPPTAYKLSKVNSSV